MNTETKPIESTQPNPNLTITQMVAAYRSGKVTRWHTMPHLLACHQTTGDHAWGVAVILMQTWPDCSIHLLKAALLHDAGEIISGDMPTEAKSVEGYHVFDAFKKACQARLISGIGIDDPEKMLTTLEKAKLAWADQREAFQFVQENGKFPQDGQMLEAIGTRANALMERITKNGELQ